MGKTEKTLVCLSPAPTNGRIIRAAARLVQGEGAELVALFVETPGYEHLAKADKERLRENMETARRLGARIEIVSGDDIPFQIGEYARMSGVDRIVIGQSDFPGRRFFPRPGLTDRLSRYVPDMEIHIIPGGTRKGFYRPPEEERFSFRQAGLDVLISVAVLAAATLLGALFDRLGFTNSNIMLAYLLGVLLIAVATSHRGYSLVSAIAAVFLFNYFFVQPRFTLNAYEVGYPVTFVVMFLTAFVTGTLAIRLKKNARQAAQSAWRTKIISDTDQMLAKGKSREEILDVCSQQLRKLLTQPFVLLEAEEGVLGEPRFYPPESGAGYDRAEEAETLDRVLSRAESGTDAGGAGTGYMYFPVHVQERVYAIVGVDRNERPLEASEQSVLLSVLGECALALENEKNAREKEEAAVLVENERLRSTLLRSISHDLRTPLTSISGNASNLLSNADAFDAETRRKLYADIYEDSLWLIKLVENLLASTRMENGGAGLNLTTELAEELIAEAVQHIRPGEQRQRIVVEPAEELILVRADARLIVQVIVNLVDNAVKYTPPDATIRISVSRVGAMAAVSVADNGEGVAPEDRERVFDMFYVGQKKFSDSRRSLGLGLALCRTIVRAHGGEIAVTENRPHGAVFTFTLPAEEVTLHG